MVEMVLEIVKWVAIYFVVGAAVIGFLNAVEEIEWWVEEFGLRVFIAWPIWVGSAVLVVVYRSASKTAREIQKYAENKRKSKK